MENVPKFFVYLQLKDEAQLALKKMPSSEQEALSLVCDIPFLIFMFCLVLFLILWIPFLFFNYHHYSRKAGLCSGESYLTVSLGLGFEAASPHLQREDLPQFISSPYPAHVGACGTGSAFCFSIIIITILLWLY
jgi:hypothetical protein